MLVKNVEFSSTTDGLHYVNEVVQWVSTMSKRIIILYQFTGGGGGAWQLNLFAHDMRVEETSLSLLNSDDD